MKKKSVINLIIIIFVTFQCFVIFGIKEFSCSPVEHRGDEQFSTNFPGAKTDDFNEFDGYDYIKIDNGKSSVIRFQVRNDLASGQDFQLKLENITPWDIAFTTSSDTMPLWVDGHMTETSDIWITSTVVGEKLIYLNVSLGSKYTVQALMLVSLPPSLTLSVDHTTQLVDTGGQVDFNVSIENNLGDPDQVDISLSGKIVEGTIAADNSWIGSLSDDSFTISGNSVKNIVLTVFPPNFGEPRQIVVGLDVDSQNGGKEYTQELEVVIRSNYGMLLHTAVLEKAGNPGNDVIYEVGVNNTGNADLELTPKIDSLPENWTLVFTPVSATISPGSREVFEIHIGIASKSLTGTNTVKLNFTSKEGLWEKMNIEIFVNPTTGLTLAKTFASTETLHQGDSRQMTFYLTSTSNANRNVTISLATQPSSINAYFTDIYTEIDGENTTKDFTSVLNLDGVSGIIKPLQDQKSAELRLTLAPYQKIWVWVRIDFSNVPLQSEETALVLINGTMGRVSKTEALQFQIKANRLEIISINIDNKLVENEDNVKLSESSKHTLSLLIKNKLTVKATGLTVHLSVDGEEDVVEENIDVIAPGEEILVVLSWKTKSMDLTKEQMLEFTLTDHSGGEEGAGHISIQLIESKQETQLSTGYMVLAIIFIIAIGVFIIVVIKSVKKSRKDQEEKPKIRKSRKEREEDEFFVSDRNTYYTEKDYESMGTTSGSRSGKINRKERLMKRSKTLKRERKVGESEDGEQ